MVSTPITQTWRSLFSMRDEANFKPARCWITEYNLQELFFIKIFVYIRCFPVFISLLFFVKRVAREALFWVFALELFLPRWRGDSSSSVISRRSSCFLLQRPLSQSHSFQRRRKSFSFLFPHFHFAFLSMCSKKREKRAGVLFIGSCVTWCGSMSKRSSSRLRRRR